jgi:hypothetical protein
MSDLMGDYSLLEDGAEYALSIAKDQASFVLRNKSDSMVAKINGDDATRFRQDYDELKSRYPEWKSDQVLAQLWDQGGYGWLAQQEE